MGAVTRKERRVAGYFLFQKRLIIGTIPHSQEGKRKPMKVPKDPPQ